MEALLFRFLERITVVLLGGLTIYLGFRLFLKVPEHKDSAGKVVLPWDISIVMTRIGPGVFFALFGVIAVSLSLLRPLEIGTQLPGNDLNPVDSLSLNKQREQLSYRYLFNPELDDKKMRTEARKPLRKGILALNTMPNLLCDDIPKYERDSMERKIRYIKLLLLKPVWGEPDEGFGDFATFENWINNGASDPPPDGMEGALELFRYGLKEE